MSFADSFRELISFPECRVVCWEADGHFMERTDIPILIEPHDRNKFIKRMARIYKDVNFPDASDEKFDSYADDIVEHAIVFRPWIASEKDIQIAANLLFAIKRIETAIETALKFITLEDIAVAYPEKLELTEAERKEYDIAKRNLNVIKDFCAYCVDNKQLDGQDFGQLESEILGSNYITYNIPRRQPYGYGVVCAYGDRVDFRRKRNTSYKRTAYSVTNLYEYCFALLDYLCTHNCRLEICGNCGRYYVPSRSVRNSKYCATVDLCVEKSCADLAKERKTIIDKMYKTITDRFKRRADPNAEAELRAFQSDYKEHKNRVKQKVETVEEFKQWMEDRNDKTYIRPPKKEAVDP